MIVGLPGAGISTIFYLLCVLLMPFRALWWIARGRRLATGDARRICRQITIAAAILVAFAITGVLLGALLPPPATTAGSASGVAEQATTLPRIVGPAALVFAFATLAIVLGLVRLLATLLPLRSASPPVSTRAPVVPAPAARPAAH